MTIVLMQSLIADNIFICSALSFWKPIFVINIKAVVAHSQLKRFKWFALFLSLSCSKKSRRKSTLWMYYRNSTPMKWKQISFEVQFPFTYPVKLHSWESLVSSEIVHFGRLMNFFASCKPDNFRANQVVVYFVFLIIIYAK